MKPWKVLSSSLLILLGFTAGIALRTTPTTVSAADPTPPKPLTSVAHDSTLNGAGTTASPLGLANGAVSVAKLSPTHLPSTGQVLGFDGSNLAWKNPPSGSIHVVDSAGNDVGTLINDGLVARLVNGAAFSLSITPQGFYSSGTTFSVFYTTSDCSGAPYMDADGSGFFRRPIQLSGRALYPTSVSAFTALSAASIDGATLNRITACGQLLSPSNRVGGPVASLDLSTLNLTPPFHLQF